MASVHAQFGMVVKAKIVTIRGTLVMVAIGEAKQLGLGVRLLPIAEAHNLSDDEK